MKSSLCKRQAVAFRIRILDSMAGGHEFDPMVSTPEASAAATAFVDSLPAVRAAILAAYRAVADFGLDTLGEACDILADLQNDTQAVVERENGLTRTPLAVVTAGPLNAHLTACAAAGVKNANGIDLARNAADLGNAINRGMSRSLAAGLPEAEWPATPGGNVVMVDRALLQAFGFIDQRIMQVSEAILTFHGEHSTRRDRFAMAALPGFLAGDHPDAPWPDPQKVAARAYTVADAMMAERDGK